VLIRGGIPRRRTSGHGHARPRRRWRHHCEVEGTILSHPPPRQICREMIAGPLRPATPTGSPSNRENGPFETAINGNDADVADQELVNTSTRRRNIHRHVRVWANCGNRSRRRSRWARTSFGRVHITKRGDARFKETLEIRCNTSKYFRQKRKGRISPPPRGPIDAAGFDDLLKYYRSRFPPAISVDESHKSLDCFLPTGILHGGCCCFASVGTGRSLRSG
jgi:hypothetical protein